MSTYNMILSSNESTVVAEYEPQAKRSDSYQSEAALEQAFIKMLMEQGYEYVTIHSEDLHLLRNDFFHAFLWFCGPSAQSGLCHFGSLIVHVHFVEKRKIVQFKLVERIE